MLRSIALLSMLIQAGSFSSPVNTVLNSKEKLKIEKESNVNSRIKIYKQASERIQKNIHQTISKNDYQTVPENLKLWTLLLSESFKDIELNLKSKKKSKNLVAYEIHLRKAIASARDYKIGAPVDQQDAFDSCIEQAEKVRKRFVEIIFPGK